MKTPNFIQMTHNECEEYMYKTYPDFFKERLLPMSQTCMCWGCTIGQGWFHILDQACQLCKLVEQLTGIKIVFTQIKEKYGSARFYHTVDFGIDCKKSNEEERLIEDLLYLIVSDAENKTTQTCAECGNPYYHHPIYMHGWVYDTCCDCVKKLHPDKLETLNQWHDIDNLNESFQSCLYEFNSEEKEKIKTILQEYQNRLILKNEKDKL